MPISINTSKMSFTQIGLGALADLLLVALFFGTYKAGGFFGRRMHRKPWKSYLMTVVLCAGLAFIGPQIFKQLERGDNTYTIRLTKKRPVSEENVKLFLVLLAPGVFGVLRRFD